MTLEINPNHKMLTNLNKLRKVNPNLASQSLKQILDSCLLSTGIPFNTQNFVKRTYEFIDRELEANLPDEPASDINEKIEISEE